MRLMLDLLRVAAAGAAQVFFPARDLRAPDIVVPDELCCCHLANNIQIEIIERVKWGGKEMELTIP